MKTIQKISTMLAVFGAFSPSHLPAAQDFSTDGLIFHLFAPIPEDATQNRLANMHVKAAQRVASGESCNTAFMKEVRMFIIGEVTHAIEVVAAEKGIEIKPADYAEVFVQERLGVLVSDEQDPAALSFGIFKYFMASRLIPVFMESGLPKQTRDFSALTLIDWAHKVYLGLDYVEKGAAAIKQGMAAAGLKPANM